MSGFLILPSCIDGSKYGEKMASHSEYSSVLPRNICFCSSVDDSDFKIEEILFPCGDFYAGSLLSNIPEGVGKYVWSNGCVYKGEWRRGMRHGMGKQSWPSGAVYEGEFAGGHIYGSGTYIGPGGAVYKGIWRLNVKHGLGFQTYSNGDVFEGSWIQGVIDGPGKYTWASGNTYIGNMKNGKMSGKGILTWSNGDSFEGNWSNGLMHGFGVYKWSDGGCYIGTWTHGLKDGKGVFYPSRGRFAAGHKLYLEALRKRGLLPHERTCIRRTSSTDIENLKANEVSAGKNHPAQSQDPRSPSASLQRRWSLEVTVEKIIGLGLMSNMGESAFQNDDRESEIEPPILEREYMQGVLLSELVVDNPVSSFSRKAKKWQKKLGKDMKKPGETIIQGHRSYDLMLCLQLGIRYTVGKITPIQRREVRYADFGRRASFWMDFPKRGSQLTPPHHAESFRWKDYCPMVFRNLRELFKIDAADYMISICGNDALRELSSPGKSGSIFFLSQDDRFMIKTLRKSEVKVLLRMLPHYHHHVRMYENTLITKFFGLHRITASSGQKFRFVVMGNMFCTELRIHRRYDLKGSSFGRSTDKVEIDENTTLKDLDLDYKFYMEPSWRQALLRQIEIDSKFLESQHIMDYSLLLGVHYRAPQWMQLVGQHSSLLTASGKEVLGEEVSYPRGLVLVPRGSDDGSVSVGPHMRGSRLRASAAGDEEVDLLLPGAARLQIQLGMNMPARAEPMSHKDPGLHQGFDVVLYLGIIDILQEYNMCKKLEHMLKSLQFDPLSISAVNPVLYSHRFFHFVQKVFPLNHLDRDAA